MNAEDLKPPRYVGNKCPECNNVYSQDPVPLYVALIVLFLIVLLLGFMYVKYLMAKKESQVCMAFRQMNTRAKTKLKDLVDK
jgi:hypothetical protein